MRERVRERYKKGMTLRVTREGGECRRRRKIRRGVERGGGGGGCVARKNLFLLIILWRGLKLSYS